MKILFLSDVPLASPTSGSEQVLYHHAVQLARGGAQVFAITRQEGSARSGFRKVEHLIEGCYHIEKRHTARALFSIFKEPVKIFNRFRRGGRFQVVVSHQPLTCLALLAAGKLRNMPMIYTFHSPSHEEYELMNRGQRPFRVLPNVYARKAVERICLQKALKIMVLSRFMADRVKKIHQIDESRIVINPGGVDILRFSPSRNRKRLKRQLGFPDGHLHLLTVRNLEPRMGLDNLIRCMVNLKTTEVRVHLTIVGDGVEKENLKKLIKRLSLDDCITMTGFVSSNTLPDYYRAGDFFILPTRYLEGFGLVTPESMACGTPVLGTPVGGTQEILSGFDKKFLFRDTSPEAMSEGILDAVQNHFLNTKTYEALRRRCRGYAEQNYTWHRHVHRLKTIIAEAVGEEFINGEDDK
jgi:glycosyltransferase involved in cell wall biosynthesis